MAMNLEISSLVAILRRNMRLIAACSFVGALLGAAYLVTATRLYTASTQILIEQRQMRTLRDASTLAVSQILDPAIVESEAEVLRSQDVALAVVRKLNLADTEAGPGLFKRLLNFLFPSSGALDPKLEKELQAAKALERNLHINRAPRTNILQLEYDAPDPVRAADIANAFASAYVDHELSRRSEGMQRTQNWLQSRSDELHRLSMDADKAVQRFRAEHNLLATRGVLISEQQFNEMTTQLMAESAATAQARARYQRIKSIIDNHQTEAAVSESFSNSVMSDLRTKYLDAMKRKIDLQRKLGPSHLAVVNLNHNIDELRDQLFQELGRIADSYKNEYEIAAAREKAITERLNQQRQTAVLANDAQVQLRHLEQDAENYRTMYQSYAQLNEETSQQKGFPLTTGHVISEAHPPLSPSYPRKGLALALALGAGALVGFAATLVRESMDRAFRTGFQLREELGVELIGMLPALAAPGQPAASEPKPAAPVASASSFVFNALKSVRAALYSLYSKFDASAPMAAKPPEAAPSQTSQNASEFMRYTIDNPLSGFTETLRSVKVAADLRLRSQTPKVIGVVSLLPDEGKTLVAKNLASLLARQGAHTLLIDADLRSQSLTRTLRSEGLDRQQSWYMSPAAPPQPIWQEKESGLSVLPCVYADDDRQIAEGLSPATLQPFLEPSESAFDYIVMDLPPMGPVVSARGLAPVIDAFLLIVKWGSTPRSALRLALEKEGVIKEKLLGAILNQVSMEELELYEQPDSGDTYHLGYSVYYTNTPRRSGTHATY